jgi:TolA-binding protein
MGWVCCLILVGSWPAGSLGAPLPPSSQDKAILTRVLSVSATSTDRETVLTVEGNGSMPEYTCETFADPPRISIDLLCPSKGFESKSIPLDSPIIEKARIGHHPDRIRLVLDLKTSSLPSYSVEREKNLLRVRVSFDDQAPQQGPERVVPAEPEKGVENPVKPPQEEKAADTTPVTASVQPKDEKQQEKGGKSTMEELLEVSEKDSRPDTLVFRRAVNAFRAQRWREALQGFRSVLEKYPQGRYAERASFLMAKSYERVWGRDVSTHFVDAKGQYEVFLSRFPSSKYGVDALVAMGNLCFHVGQHEEAMGYYGLAFSRDKDSPAAAAALAGKMKILMMKRHFDDALGLAQYILEHYPRSAEATDAGLDTAKILYELNRFRESLRALSALVEEDSRNVYFHPEISLYLGCDVYQLGNFPMARENLFRFCNVSPRAEEVPFALTKIGDAYRDEKQFEDASKMYRLVAERYPDSEGALISQIRLAELQEQGERKEQEKGLGFGAQPGEKTPSPKEVYEAMLQSSKLKEAKNPLIALALLKLAVLYQKDGEYGKSLTMVKELLNRFPSRQMQKETEHVLQKALEGTVTGSIQAKDYLSAIRFYYEEKDLFSKIDSPQLYLALARAFLKVNLTDEAAALFKKAGPLLPEDDKPADLLYFTALDLQRQNQSDQALEKLKAVVEKGEDPEYVFRAYLLRGRIMAEKKRWGNALEDFTAALSHSSGPCTQLEILNEKAAVQTAAGMKEGALKSAREARALIEACGNPPIPVYEKLGEVFSLLGRADDALAILTEALGKAEEQEDQERLRWKLARTYEALGKKKDSLSMYQDVSRRNDSFWGNLAKDKIEEIRFHQEVDSFKRKSRRKAQPSL